MLLIPQPFANHNGGGLAFGNDGHLYAALGDGGSGGDPFRNGQNLASALGKVLRFDVDSGDQTAPGFRVPPDNPFLSTPGAFPAVWAYGLRNPWRISFDRATGDLMIGDVGQNVVEEVDVGLFSDRGGGELRLERHGGDPLLQPALRLSHRRPDPPVVEYSHGEGCSVTGGYVYRGCRMPVVPRDLLYGDYCPPSPVLPPGNGRAVDQRGRQSRARRQRHQSFGVDGEGEIYISTTSARCSGSSSSP